MAYKCGDCGKEHQTRKEWLDHIAEVHNSFFLEGDEKDVAYHQAILSKKSAEGDNNAKNLIQKKM